MIPLRLVPGGCATVQNRLEPGIVLGELAPKQVLEQVVIAVPHPLSVERDEEEIRTLDLRELERGAVVPEHGVAECAAHSVEHRRPPQEPERARAEARDVLLPQIIREVPVRVAAFGRTACSCSRRVLAQGEGREVETRRPTLAVADELGRLGEGQLGAGRLKEQLPFSRSERELVDADLEQPAARAEPRNRNGRRRAAGEHERGARRQVVCQRHEDFARFAGAQPVRVVHDDHNGFHRRAERRSEVWQGRGPDRRTGSHERVHDRFVEGSRRVHCSREVPQEDDRVVVVLVQRYPREGPRVPRRPLCQQGRLAVPRGGDDRDDGQGAVRPEAVDQAWPRHRSRARHRNAELRLEDLEWKRPAAGGAARRRGLRRRHLNEPLFPGAQLRRLLGRGRGGPLR